MNIEAKAINAKTCLFDRCGRLDLRATGEAEQVLLSEMCRMLSGSGGSIVVMVCGREPFAMEFPPSPAGDAP